MGMDRAFGIQLGVRSQAKDVSHGGSREEEGSGF